MKPVTLLSQDPVIAAKALLGWTLISTIGGVTTAGIIVETEAYRAADDPAAHAYRGLTERNRSMWAAAGSIYVHFTYGMHYMLNLATGPEGQAEAILIRALEPTKGIETMRRRRGPVIDTQLTSGPGKLAKALGITLAQNGMQIGGDLRLESPDSIVDDTAITTTTRIGISRGKDLPWRFYVTDSRYISKR